MDPADPPAVRREDRNEGRRRQCQEARSHRPGGTGAHALCRVIDPVHVTADAALPGAAPWLGRSEEHTSELQSLMRISYAVFCLKKKRKQKHISDNEANKQEHIRKLMYNIKPNRT